MRIGWLAALPLAAAVGLSAPGHRAGARDRQGRPAGAAVRHLCAARARSCAWAPSSASRTSMPPAASRRWAAPSSSWSCWIPATPPRRPRTRRSAWSPSTTTWSPRPAPICRSFTLAVTEVTERAKLPMLTLSYSDMITERGFDYIFQTSATSGSQAIQSLPTLVELARSAGARSEDRRDRHRQHRGLDLVRQADARASAQGAGAGARGRRDLHAAAGGCDALDPAAAHDPAGSVLLPADRDLRCQARAREDERVRPRPGPHPDRLVRHRDRRAGHAQHDGPGASCRASWRWSRTGARRATRT